MKLFKKKQKNKKPLTDKAKQEKKDKTKRIIKRVLDILVYGFAFFMIFGLLLGSCNTKAKSGSAYYHSDTGYTSINGVVVTDSTTTTLRYYYDYNYKKTFPKWLTLFDIFPTLDINTGFPVVKLSVPLTIDNVVYNYLALKRDSYALGGYSYSYVLSSNPFKTSGSKITIITLTTNDIFISRSDLLTSLFSGSYVFEPYLISVTNNSNWFRYLTYYFGELGYNRITYSFPINVSRLAYLFVNSDNTENLIENGYFFKNDNFPTIEDNIGVTTFENILIGSFRCNGVYYSSIRFAFSSVFGKMYYDNDFYDVKYLMPGSSNIDDYVPSWNEFYQGYWYIDKIYFENADISQLVWSAFRTQITPYPGNDYFLLSYGGSWVGDTAYSSSPYRDLFIYYVESALTGPIAYPFNDNYPQLTGMSFADFINFIGEAYPSGNTGAPTDTTAPFTSVFEWLRIALAGAMPMFGYTVIPGITIGTLIMVPITMSIILFVVKLFKR